MKKKVALPLIIAILYILISFSSISLLYVIYYYVGGCFLFLITCSLYYTDYFCKLRIKKSIKQYMDYAWLTNPDQVNMFDVWLKEEGFELDYNLYARIHLKNAIARVRYFPAAKTEIEVIQEGPTTRYKIYDDDVELKIKMLYYLMHVNEKYSKVKKKDLDSILVGDKELTFAEFYCEVLFRIQGYLFFILGICNIHMPIEAKIALFIGYSIIEVV